ncbi:MAG: hypothetical protein WBA00_15665 [Rhodococcus sp. (in: high G+C Gram-positive bacteria)]
MYQRGYIFLSHSHFEGGVKVGSHHLSEKVAAIQGSGPVFHISTPVSVLQSTLRREKSSDRYKMSRAGARKREEVTDIVPSQVTPPRWRVSTRANRKFTTSIHTLDVDQWVVLVDQPLFHKLANDVRASMNVPTKIIYRPTDIHPSGPLARAEKRMVAIADAIIATSQYTLETVREQSRADRNLPSYVIENGVDIELFSGSNLAETMRSGFIYVGAIDSRFDWESVILLAAAFPQESFTLVGPVSAEVPQLPPNVSCVGTVPYAGVPALMAQAKVGLLPFNSNSLNAGRSPMKFYEYLAAGLVVTGSRTSELDSRHAPNTWLWDNAANVVAKVSQAYSQDASSAGIEHARQFDWKLRAAELVRIIDSLFDSNSG